MKKLEIGDFLYTQMQQYGKTIYEVVNIGQQCGCKQNDKITLQIVCNNNYGYDGTQDKFYPYNQKKGYIFYDCEKNIAKNITKNKMKLFNEQQKIVLRQRLLDNEWN